MQRIGTSNGQRRPSDLKHVSLEMPSSSVSLRRRLLAPFLSPFLDGERFVADVINYIAGGSPSVCAALFQPKNFIGVAPWHGGANGSNGKVGRSRSPASGRRGGGKNPALADDRQPGEMTRSRLLCLGWSCADLFPMQTWCRRDLRGLGTRLRVLAAKFAS